MSRANCSNASGLIPLAAGASRAFAGIVWVSLILDMLAAGESVEAILRDYSGLTREDIQACIAYGSEMARERFMDIPLESKV